MLIHEHNLVKCVACCPILDYQIHAHLERWDLTLSR